MSIDTSQIANSPWWSGSIAHAFELVDSSPDSISQDEAEKRLKQYGKNVLAEQKRLGLLERFIAKLTNPLIVILLVAAGLSAGLRQASDVIIIVLITIVSITVDVLQEHQAIEGAEKLRQRVSLTASVTRDGIKKEIPLSHIVAGDIVSLHLGDMIPADCRIISANDLLVDESTLTGESFPVEKRDSVPDGHVAVNKRSNVLYMGTHVVSGEGMALVMVTGSATQLGHVATQLVTPREKTEFEKGITDFGYLLTKTAVVVSLVVLGAHFFLAHNILESLLFVLALAIGFAPELLPIVITINLSKGAIRMGKRGVIVKSLPAIENFGSMDILATDKTGTLTENAVTLTRFEDIDGKPNETLLEYAWVNSFFQTGFRGPMETAIIAREHHGDHGFSYIATIPFDFYRKSVSVIVKKDKSTYLFAKGAPEEMVKASDWMEKAGKRIPLTAHACRQIDTCLKDYGADGFRVLAVGYKTIERKKSYTQKDESGLTFVGFLVFADPAKSTVADAIRRLGQQGIQVKVLTGDNEMVTRKICHDIHLPVSGVLRGDEIEKLSDSDLKNHVEGTTIFARLNPDVKVRVIKALRAQNHVVGYLGDGVNDAPSLRAADIGISVNNATDIAKESADIILLRRDLHVLADGVVEGRKTFGNVMKYLKMGMSSNFGNMVSVALASLFLPFLPMLPTQILLNDLLYDSSQLLLASDSVDATYLQKPRRWNVGAIRKFMVVFGPISSVFDFITFYLLLTIFKAQAPLFQTGWFLESIITQTIIILSIRTTLVPFYKSRASRVFIVSLLVVVAIALALPLSPLATLFSFTAPPQELYVFLGIILISYVLVVELTKKWFYSRNDV